MIPTRIPLRLAARTVRHQRMRHRPVALVFRRPPRMRPPARPLAFRAGDQISVTLAPRFTVILQQAARAVNVVSRFDRPATDARSDLRAVVAGSGRLVVVHRPWSPPWQNSARPPGVAIVGDGVARASGRDGVTRRAVALWRPQAAHPTIATSDRALPAAPGPRPKVAAGGGIEGRRSLGLVPVRAKGTAVDQRRHRSTVLEGRRAQRAVVNVAPRRSIVAPARLADRAATLRPLQRRCELVLGAPTRSAPPHEAAVARVETVYRRVRSTEPTPPPSPRAVSPPDSRPAVDIDQLDRELWRRFEKRARTERVRHGRA